MPRLAYQCIYAKLAQCRIVDDIDTLQSDFVRSVLHSDLHQRLAKMIEISIDKFDRLGARGEGFLGLTLGLIFLSLPLGQFGLDLEAGLILEFLLPLGIGRRLVGFLALIVLGLEPRRLLFGLEARGIRRSRLRPQHLRIWPPGCQVIGPAARHRYDRYDRNRYPEANWPLRARLRCWNRGAATQPRSRILRRIGPAHDDR